MARPITDLTGIIFGRLRVIKRHGYIGRYVSWNCVCECGSSLAVIGRSLVEGNTQSCGCLRKERAAESTTTHGMVTHEIYPIWQAMIQRCTNPNHRYYKNYGGRGIKVCEEWMDFQNFHKDMGERPAKSSLERRDSDGNYEPSNCIWATMKDQQRNRTNNNMVTYDNKTQCITAWAEEIGINSGTLRSRINNLGWDVKRAIETPVRGIELKKRSTK